MSGIGVLRSRLDTSVLLSEWDRGGHFAGLDNPPALIEDIREIANYYDGAVF